MIDKCTMFIVYFCAFFILVASSARAEPVSTYLSSMSAGTIKFTSNDGYDLVKFKTARSIIVKGNLTIPENHNGGAVILSHGSGGISNRHHYWRKFLEKNGFAVFLLDHFGPRNVTSVANAQIRVTEQQMAFDILYALKLLATHPAIQDRKIYHIGWSKGAGAGLLASTDQVRNLVFPLNNKARFSGFIEFYPWCGMRGKIKTYAPVLILHGTDDDYTPIAFCEVMVKEMRQMGSEIRIERFEGSVHAFDSWSRQFRQYDHITVRESSDDCTLRINPLTLEIQSENGKYSIDNVRNRKAYLMRCYDVGVWLGGSPKYEKRTQNLISKFLSD